MIIDGLQLIADRAPFATTVSGFLTPILIAVVIAALGWTGRTLIKLTSVVEMLVHEVIPDGQPSLKDKVNQVSSDVAVIKDRSVRKPDSEPDNPS
jgi:hypothetical protein